MIPTIGLSFSLSGLEVDTLSRSSPNFIFPLRKGRKKAVRRQIPVCGGSRDLTAKSFLSIDDLRSRVLVSMVRMLVRGEKGVHWRRFEGSSDRSDTFSL